MKLRSLDGRLRSLAAMAAIVLAVIVLYHRVLPLGGEPTARVIYDSLEFSYPYVLFMNRCLSGGVWPAWNPYEFGGVPFWGNLQSLLFHPPTLLSAALFEMTLARFQVLEVAQIAIGGMGMFLWGSARGRSRFAGLVGALLFVGGGIVVNFFTHYGLLSLYCLLPYPFAFFERWDQSRRLRHLLLAGVSISLWLVTSYPSQLGYYLLAFGVYVLARRVRLLPSWRREWPLLGRELLVLGVIAPALAFIHLVPALELASIISRGHGVPIEKLREVAGHPSQLFSIAFGGVAPVTSSFRFPDISLRDYSVGLVGVFAALYALTRPTRGRWLLLLAAFACGDLMMRESWLLPIVYRLSFLTRNSYYPSVEFGSLLAFILLTLAVDGIGELATAPWATSRIFTALFGVVLLLVGFEHYGAPHYALGADARARTLLPVALLLVLVAAAWAARRWLGRIGAVSALGLVLVAATADVYVNVRDNEPVLYVGFSAADFVAQAASIRTVAASYLDLRSHLRRKDSYPSPSHLPLIDGWRSDWGYDATVPTLTSRAVATPEMRSVLLDERPAFVADEIRIVDDPQRQPLLDGNRTIAAFPPRMAPALPDIRGAPPASIRVSEYSINGATYRIETPWTCVVIFNELALPGWTARVDGVRRPIFTANGTLRALIIPPGSHKCEFRYRPPRLGLAVAGSVVGLLLLLGVALSSYRRR